LNGQLGDYVRAVRALHADADDAKEIARMLGLSFRRRAAAPGPVAPSPGEQPPERQPREKAEKNEEQAVPQEIEYVDFTIERHSAGEPSRPEWLSTVTPLPSEAMRYQAPKLPLEPLLAPNRARALLSTLLATSVEEGRLDVDRMIRTIARAEPLVRLYRLRSLTVRRGLQLLIDHSTSMVLFQRDVQWLTGELRKVIGADRVDVRLFANCPTRGSGAPMDDEWGPWRPPAHGTPVLLLTDFGIGASPLERGSAIEWEAFLLLARRAGCPLFALNPYASDRWPEIARRLAVVRWDRKATVQMMRKAATGR
jgi:hypothetical protein